MCYNEFAQKLCSEIMIANQCKQKIGEENGFKNVLTCLNSGNVVFETDEKKQRKNIAAKHKGSNDFVWLFLLRFLLGHIFYV